MHRVAITGIGIVSSLGGDVNAVGDALRRGESGVVLDEERVCLGFRGPLSGRVRGFDCDSVLTRKQRKTMPDFAIQAYKATADAIRMANLSPEEIQSEETGLIFGCDSSCIAAIEQTDLLRKGGDTRVIGSGLVFRSMTSCITMNLNTLTIAGALLLLAGLTPFPFLTGIYGKAYLIAVIIAVAMWLCGNGSITSIFSTPGAHCPICSGSVIKSQTFLRGARIVTSPLSCIGVSSK